jgi:hypothetical protein
MGYRNGMKTAVKPGIFLTWLPLAAMWILMAVEQPAVSAVIARMDDAKRELAAFGVTFSLALFIEGPIIQILAAATAIADNRENYERLRSFLIFLGGSATFIHVLLCIPGVFEPFAVHVLGLPDLLLDSVRRSLTVMIPFTLGVGFRRLWQGVLIRYGASRLIPVTMVIRICVTFAVLAWGLSSGVLTGSLLSGLAITLGVLSGAVSSWWFVRPFIANLPGQGAEGGREVLGVKAMAIFYIPLALTNFIILGARPLIQMGIARGNLPLESLALWPVSMGYLFLYNAFALSSQEVVIAKLEDHDSRRGLIRFSAILSLVLTVIFLLVINTPLWRLWFSKVSGLTPDLVNLAQAPLLLSIPVVIVNAYISLFRGSLVRQKRTGEVTAGVAVNVSVLLVTLFAGVAILPMPAIAVAAGSYALSFIAEFAFLISRRPLRAFIQS